MTQFQDMPLAEPVKKALEKLGFKEPTKVQNAVIDQALEGKDIMACAETGSGKTGAFGIPMVERLLEKKGRRALILAPTRELAKQIADFMTDLTRYCEDVNVATLVGGTDMQKQFRALKKNPRIVVATPGRLNDHLRRRSLKLDTTEILVLDEGDRMLDMGFQPQLDDILDYLPKERQTHLFTATLPAKVKRLAEDYLQDPIRLDVGRVSQPVEKIKQSIIQVNNKEKDDKLVDELNKREGSVIVFFRTKARTDEVADYLEDYGFKVGVIHGDRSQGQRNRAIQQFKGERTRILCATDVAARGIDIPSVGHVINYDLPRMEEDYVHRIGRTARNGAEGEAVSFVARQDHSAWMRLAKRYKIQGVELENVSAGSGGGRRDGGGRRRSGGGREGERTERPKRYARAGDSGSRSRRDDAPQRRRTGESDGPSGRWADSKPKRDDRRSEGGERSERRDDRRGRPSDRPDRRGERKAVASERPARRDDRRAGSSDRPERRDDRRASSSDRPERRDDRRASSSDRPPARREERRGSESRSGADSRGNFAKRSKTRDDARRGSRDDSRSESRSDSKSDDGRSTSPFKVRTSEKPFGGPGRPQSAGARRRPARPGENKRSSERSER